MKIRTIASITFVSLIITIAVTAHVVTAASDGTEGKPLAPGRIIAALPAGNGSSALVLTLHHGRTYDTVYAVLLDGDDVVADEFFWLPNDEEPTLAALVSGCNLYLFASWPGGEMARRYWWELPPGYCASRVGRVLLPVVVK